MSRLVREPLLHFVVLGAMVFAADAFLRHRSGERGADEIVVSPRRIENLAALFAKTRQRAPTATELRSLVDDYVLEEAFYRDGMALGVDRDDPVIRRRVRQKMEFFVDEAADASDPDDAALGAWLAEHPESYVRPSRFSFRQVHLAPDRRGDALSDDVERLLAMLRRAAGPLDARELGDPSRLGHEYVDAEAGRLAGDFGQGFADRLAELPTGEWSGPVESAFGLHLVFVAEKSGGDLPGLSEVRDAVVRDWRYAQREQASRAFEEEVLSRYRVTIDWPERHLARSNGS